MSEGRVLLIDSDTWQLGVYQRFLKDAGFEYDSATNSSDAMEAIELKKPDAIVLDALLEGNSAFVLLHELQSDAELSKIPVIMATNIAQDFSLKDVAPYGVKRLIDKTTVHPSDMVFSVRAVIA